MGSGVPRGVCTGGMATEKERERESPIVMASKLESMASNLLANLREIDR